MRYYNMSSDDIKHHSRTFLNLIYQQYPRRSAENLGISLDENMEQDNSADEEYPSEFKNLNKKELEKIYNEDKRTEEEFLSQFPSFG